MTVQAHCAPRAAEPRVIAQKYRLESLLGEGGMGSVWRAFNLQLEVPVAIKLLRPDLPSAELGERLRVEARAGAKLVHPSIVRVFDIGEAESGDPFIVMELLNGESLGELLERGPLPPIDALQVLLPIAEGLSLAHSRGVVHRDLKPDNIFLRGRELPGGTSRRPDRRGRGRGRRGAGPSPCLPSRSTPSFPTRLRKPSRSRRAPTPGPAGRAGARPCKSRPQPARRLCRPPRYQPQPPCPERCRTVIRARSSSTLIDDHSTDA